MPHEPKKRHSRQRQGKRRANISLTIQKTIPCSHCGSMIKSHTVCKTCGFYNGKQVIKIEAKRKNVSA